MPAPTFELVTRGAAPNQYAQESDFEGAVNAALAALWADVTAAGGKQFGSRAQAASVGQAALPTALGMIVTMENGVATYRAPNSSTDDPLFPGVTAPYWGVVSRGVPSISRTVSNADGATNRSTATYLTPNTDVVFNPNGEGGLVIKAPPANGNIALVNARMTVRYRGNAVIQTIYLSDGKVYEKAWLGGAEGAWADKTPYAPPIRQTVNANTLGGPSRNFNAMLALDTTYTSDGTVLMANAPPSTANAYVAGKWQTFDAGPMLVQRVWLDGQPEYSSYDRYQDKATAAFTAWIRPQPPIVSGPRLVALGDSITAGVGVGANDPDGYALRAALLLNSPITRLAAAGRMMCGTTAGDLIPTLDLAANAATIADAEIIWVAYGTNDWGGNVPIGTEADTANGTFFGAMAEGLAKLRALNPTAKICFLTPIYRGHAYSDPKDWSEAGPNSLGLHVEDYRTAIRRFCALNGIPVMEMSAGSEINAATAPTYLPADQLHPGRLGHRVMGDQVAKTFDAWGWADLVGRA